MTNFKQFISRPAVRKTAAVLPVAALLLLAGPAMAGDGTTGPLAGIYTVVNGLTPGIKGIVAVVGFIVALISLVALRSFAAVLFFLGLAVFGSAGLAVATTIISGPLSLI